MLPHLESQHVSHVAPRGPLLPVTGVPGVFSRGTQPLQIWPWSSLHAVLPGRGRPPCALLPSHFCFWHMGARRARGRHAPGQESVHGSRQAAQGPHCPPCREVIATLLVPNLELNTILGHQYKLVFSGSLWKTSEHHGVTQSYFVGQASGCFRRNPEQQSWWF